MNKNRLIVFSLLVFCIQGTHLYGQDVQSKTYKESFTVNPDAVLNIDTSHADIEFETWNKNQVEITAVIELEGATQEEGERYFENDVVTIVGNSREIEINTKNGNRSFLNGDWDFNYNFEVVPDISFVEPLFEDLKIPELPEIFVIPDLPPMPPIPQIHFDYDAFKKNGDEYLERWKKEFDENFDEQYKERLKAWSNSVKEKAEVQKKKQEALKLERDALVKKTKADKEKILRNRDKIIKKYKSGKVLSIQSDNEPNVFYFSSNGENKKYKVKKRIKVKMPKSVKLKMNVRHGEVKLAANTKNINASLSYASLLATTIDGQRTDIRASYSPIDVKRWNHGQLRTNYSDKVKLKEVKELSLNAVSSKVTIDRLVDKALVDNNLGELYIKAVSDDFSNLDIYVENGEVDCKLPEVPFTIYVNEITSDFKYPQKLSIGTSKNYNMNVHKGYHINDNQNRSINIKSKYSEVVLK